MPRLVSAESLWGLPEGTAACAPSIPARRLPEGAVGTAEMVEDGVGFGCADAALAAVRQWRFRPATLCGRPVAVFLAELR